MVQPSAASAVARPVAVTVTEAFRAYAASESPLKKTGRKEAVRIEHLLGVMPFADWPVATVTSDHLGRWQQSRRHRPARGTRPRQWTWGAGAAEG